MGFILLEGVPPTSPPHKKFHVFWFSDIFMFPNIGGVMRPKTDADRKRMYAQKYGLSESEARKAKSEEDMKRIASRKTERRSNSR